MKLRSFFIPLFLSVFFAGGIPSCVGEEGKTPGERKKPVRKAEEHSLKVIKPGSSERVTAGENISINFAWVDTIHSTDSTEIFLDATLAEVLGPGTLSAEISTKGIDPGTRRVRVIVHHTSGRKETFVFQVIILSEIIPEQYTYRVKNQYPHDIGAYTQGFEYSQGYFYEGTGQYNESTLRKTDMHTGQILKAKNLPGDIFGEGITILHDKIYQITYRSQVGFVYDLESFELVQKIYYQNQEGWGLTNNGELVIMSDGTNNIYFMDPEYFHVTRKIEVMDHSGPVDALNELEWVEGKIWANRYLTDDIVIIDPESGRVEGKINLSGLIKQEDKHSKIDVLNGIAWDKEGKRLFVTGKYWPEIFEVEIFKSNK